MAHVVLVGDSIFDNAVYVASDESVIEKLDKSLTSDVKSTLLAVDGAVTSDIQSQLKNLPPDTTHLFISSGGNDALRSIETLDIKVSTVMAAMSIFSEVIEEFRRDYRKMLRLVTGKVDQVSVCTIYNSVPGMPKEALTALKLFNEVILSEATELGLPIIDLRLVCSEQEDYSSISPIEPSEQGGEKIVNIINKVLEDHDFDINESVLYWQNMHAKLDSVIGYSGDLRHMIESFIKSPPPLGNYLSYKLKYSVDGKNLAADYIISTEELRMIHKRENGHMEMTWCLYMDTVETYGDDAWEAYESWLFSDLDKNLVEPVPVPEFVTFEIDYAEELVACELGKIFCATCHQYYLLTETVATVKGPSECDYCCPNDHLLLKGQYMKESERVKLPVGHKTCYMTNRKLREGFREVYPTYESWKKKFPTVEDWMDKISKSETDN